MSDISVSGFSVSAVTIPVPILRYTKWLSLKPVADLSETAASDTLRQRLPELLSLAVRKHIPQIKILAPEDWDLRPIGLLPASGYLERETVSLLPRDPDLVEIENLEDPSAVDGLFRQNCEYHHRRIPYYFAPVSAADLRPYSESGAAKGMWRLRMPNTCRTMRRSIICL